MNKVVFVGGFYQDEAPFGKDLGQGLNNLGGLVRRERGFRDSINRSLKSPDYMLPSTTIEDAVEGLRVDNYLSRRNVRVGHPESGSARFPSDFYLVYPYNLDPDLSLAVLVALYKGYTVSGVRPAQGDLFNGVTFLPFSLGGEERELVDSAINYLTLSAPHFGDRRGLEQKIRLAARKFMNAYESSVKEVHTDEKFNPKRVILLLAFVATYRRMRAFLQQNNDLNRRNSSSYEFTRQYIPQDINFTTIDQILKSTQTNDARFVTARDMATASKERLRNFIYTNRYKHAPRNT